MYNYAAHRQPSAKSSGHRNCDWPLRRRILWASFYRTSCMAQMIILMTFSLLVGGWVGGGGPTDS